MGAKLWWNTGHTSEKDLWQKSVAANFATELRERGDLNPPGDARFRKIESLANAKGTQIRVELPLPRGTVVVGLSSVTENAAKNAKFAEFTLADGTRGAIDLTNPEHSMAIRKPGGGWEEHKLKAQDVDKDKKEYNANAVYLMAA